MTERMEMGIFNAREAAVLVAQRKSLFIQYDSQGVF